MIRTLHCRLASLLLVLAIALAGLQFSSNSVRAELTKPSLVAYLAAGGSLADLCLSEDGQHDHSDCPFCREADVFALTERVPYVETATRTAKPLIWPVASILPPQQVLGVPPARAPPLA